MMRFIPEFLDTSRSPYTGLTRDSWIQAGKHLLEGIFQHIQEFDAPVVMPRQETEITYPHKSTTGGWKEIERKSEIFEGLTRSLFIAAPLLHNEPELMAGGYPLADYYKKHILRACTSGDALSVGSYQELCALSGSDSVFQTFQQTVETCALVIGLWMCKEVIWDTYTREEKDVIAHFLSSYAHASTVPQNWRLFNMLDLAFLDMNGYEIDHEIMLDHAAEILNYYAGDGWYRDGQSFDYYSCWAFNVYGPIWNLWYGYEKAPKLAKRFEEHSNKLMETYPDFFDGDGWTNMWGRSNVYRCASTSPFPANALLTHSSLNCGRARRICSGSLLQFLTREEFYFQGLPTMGFYGQFSPLVQGYSCAESPFWLGKTFLCLMLPEDHPFWTAKEENGVWGTDCECGQERKLDSDKEEKNRTFPSNASVKVTTLNGPGLCYSNHIANYSTILRTGKVVKNCGDIHGMWNYGKLSYHSKYPWESTPKIAEDHLTKTPGGQMGEETEKKAFYEMEAQQYVLTDLTDGHTERCNVALWYGEKDGILYRRHFFNYSLSKETHWMHAVNLADVPVKYGILRMDKLRLYRRPVAITLGAYGFPDHDTKITYQQDGTAKAIILKGYDSIGNQKQLAMTIYDGFDELCAVKSTGTNPESEHSIIAYATAIRRKQYGSAEPYMLISQVITKESHEDFEREEIFPIMDIQYEDIMQTGGTGTVTIRMKDDSIHRVDFEGIEGVMML